MQTQTNSNELNIEALNLRKAALVYRAVNNNLRQQILLLLHRNRKMIVTDIYVKLRIEQSVASQHLAILRKNNIVKTQRDGKRVYYSINYDRLQQIEAIAGQLIDIPKGE